MNIVFCLNKSYLNYWHVAIASLLHNNSKSEISVYILTADITLKEIDLIGLDIDIKIINVESKRFENFAIGAHYSIETYFRLIIPELLDIDKCLYLDADIVIENELISLYNTDISSYLLAAVQESPVPHLNVKLQIPASHEYFNAGVMLLNLHKIRESKAFENAILFLEENPEKITYVDQCAINWACHNQVLYLDLRYNVTKNFVDDVNQDTAVIYHFDGPKKPWHYNGRKELREVYQKYLKLANPKYEKYDNVTFHQIISRHVPPYIKICLLRLLKR